MVKVGKGRLITQSIVPLRSVAFCEELLENSVCLVSFGPTKVPLEIYQRLVKVGKGRLKVYFPTCSYLERTSLKLALYIGGEDSRSKKINID